MCNMRACELLLKLSYNYTVHNRVSCVKSRQASFIRKSYSTLTWIENKCISQLPLQSMPLLLNKRVKYSILSNAPCNFYCTENKTNVTLPKLMDFPEIAWPSIIKSMRNWILTRFIIMRHFDREFNLHSFTVGSKKAVEVVSGILSEGEVTRLDGLVSADIMPELKTSLSTFSMGQRQQLSVTEDDIYFTFPYEVGVIFPNEHEEDKERQQIFVEITMCYHSLKGLKEMRSNGEPIPFNIGVMPEFKDKLIICNYRFIREFTKGVAGDWTINALNHFRPVDQLK